MSDMCKEENMMINKAVLKTVWRRIRKPSRATMESLEATGAKVDYWPDYQPRQSRANKKSIFNDAHFFGSTAILPTIPRAKRAP